MKKDLKPFVKWAGGKSQLISELINNFNFECETYIEAFTGGGAFFLYLLDNIEKTKLKKLIINDINKNLITVYETIKDSVYELIEELTKLQNLYNNLETIEEKEQLFYSIREEFNTNQNSKIKLSRDFIFLNKTCFNGLYRENSKGFFNVPFGKKRTVSLFEYENLKNISEKLNLKIDNKNVVEIYCENYDFFKSKIDKNVFFYIDPPYRPVTKNGFTSYNKSNFNDTNQIELSEFCNIIDKKGGYFLLSNSDPKILDENDNFFDELYKNYNIKRVFARRNINSKGNGRGKISEILVKNFDYER